MIDSMAPEVGLPLAAVGVIIYVCLVLVEAVRK